MKVPLMNLKTQYDELKDEIDACMTDIAGSSRFILGPETEDFENDIAKYCGTKYGLGVGSGTEALILALYALGLKEGDEVITTPATFIATAEAVSRVGAKPVFADIDPLTYNIDPEAAEKAVGPRTKAIIPVHLYGNPCDMERIGGIAERHGLKVVEDCAQAIGASYGGKKVGSFGVAGCFSFFPSKNLGAFGDGGMIVTDDDELYKRLKLLRVHGTTKKYHHSLIGFNSRLDNLQAAILSIKFKRLEKWNENRRRIAARYSEALKDIAGVPVEQKNARSVYHLYMLRVDEPKRDPLVRYLNEEGIQARVYYPVPVHLQECYRDLGYKQGDFPEAERASEETFALPLYSGMTEEQADYVIENVRKGIKG